MPTVDLRFMVHNADQVKSATKSLIALNVANKNRTASQELAARADLRGMKATKQLNNLRRQLAKEELNAINLGIMSEKELIGLKRQHNSMLLQQTKDLQDYVETDRQHLGQQKRLNKEVANSIAVTTKYNKETVKLRDSHDSLGSAKKKLIQGEKDIARAFGTSASEMKLAGVALKALRDDFKSFELAHKSGSIVNAGNQFARYGDQAYRAQQKVKRFASVGMQQAGYQVNDFIVQIASGQNALVAFGQQGSQLAGIFGHKGAVVGAVIAAVAAIGNLVYQYYKAKKGVEDLAKAIEKLPELYNSIESASKSLADDLIEPWRKGERAARSYVKFTSEADFALTEKTFLRSINNVESFWEGISTRFFGKKNVVGLATAIQTEIDKVKDDLADQKRKEIPTTEKSTMQGSNYVPNAGYEAGNTPKDYTVINKRIDDLTELRAELQGLFKETETIEQRVVKFAKLRQKYSPEGDKPSASVTKELDALIKATGYHDLILKYHEKAAEEAATRVAAMEDLISKTTKMGEVTAANGARETLIAKHARDLLDESNRLKKVGIKISEGAAKAALEGLSAAHEAELVKFDELEAEKARLKVEKERAAAEKKRLADAARAEKAAKAITDQQDKVYRIESARIETQRKRNNLLEAEEAHGKTSNKAQLKRIAIAENLVEVRMRERFLLGGITGEEELLITSAKEVAKEGVEFADALRDTLEITRQVNFEISKMQGLLDNLNNFGTGIDKALEKARAVGDALRKGENTSIASQIADKKFELAQIMQEISNQSTTMGTVAGRQMLAAAEITKTADLAQLLVLEAELKKNDALRKQQKASNKKTKAPKEELSVEAMISLQKAELQYNLEKRKRLIGTTELEKAHENIRMTIMDKIRDKYTELSAVEKKAAMDRLNDAAAYIALEEERVAALEKTEQFYKDLAGSIGSSFDSNFMSIVDGTKSVSEAFKGMAADIVRHLFKVLVIQSMIRAMGGAMSMAGGPMGAVGGALMTYGNANGNAFSNGNVVPYANGGVVGAPTYFPMSGNRTGLMGEAGPEAIMPLKRGKNGKLGVQADGGGDNVVIHQNFNFTANGDESVKQIIAQQAPAIANMTKQSILSDRRRGGQMKQAFG